SLLVSAVILAGNAPHHEPATLYLDAEYDIPAGSRVYVERAGERILSYVPTAAQIAHETLAAYGISGKSTRLDLGEATWFSGNDFSNVRTTRVYLATERLTPAEEPIATPVPGEQTPNAIQLNGVYEGLVPGRWVVVSGERADLDGVGGVMASELVMIRNAAVVSDNGRPRTELTFANELAYRYKRDTAVLLANTVRATHGETVSEVLGSGDARRRWPAFDLRKPPLTYLPAPTPAGAESTLTVRVNDVRWREADNHVLLGPADRAYVLERREEKEFDATTVIFGDGRNGARLPTGVENVTAVYRSGLGQAGNVPAGRIKQLATRPLGVKDVSNALPATGGADREGRDSTRANAPLAVMALDRLVSVTDYADLARTFAGIGKAAAAELSDGRRSVVHLTIAGADDIPIDTTSDLYRNLRLALARAGDPWTPVQIALRELILLVVIAGVRLHPDYLWSAVAPQIRARLYERLSFGRRDLGQDVTAGEIIAAIHSVPGVVYADLDLLDGLTGADVAGPALATRLADLAKDAATPNARPRARIKAEMARPDRNAPTVLQPAQLAILDPRLPETLILKELT
ncbi:MAG: putative baseplate assembly protein, partial [Candidatus Promineofilum sp.]|nr:putative baseplate assembly protein [Promineifilum sp.]